MIAGGGVPPTLKLNLRRWYIIVHPDGLGQEIIQLLGVDGLQLLLFNIQGSHALYLVYTVHFCMKTSFTSKHKMHFES